MTCGVLRYVADVILRVSGAGYIFVWLALTSSVMCITTYYGTVECPSAPALNHYAPTFLEPSGNFQSYTSISPPRDHTPRATQIPILIRKLTATSNQTPIRNPMGATISSDQQPNIVSYHMTMHYDKVAILGIIWACLGLT
eukprot:8868513-Pyramimonas_sp.AAC.1